MTEETLSYRIAGPIFEIHISNPQALNSFTIPEFVKLAELFDLADQHEETKVTLLTSTATFFSTGANIKYISKLVKRPRLEYYDCITSKNILLVHTILNHKKLIVVALNGPVIGLSAALVCLMDIVYARVPTDGKSVAPYMQFPFSSIGLVNECGVSASLPYRLGLTRSLEAVSMARKITLEELVSSGLVSKTFETNSVDSFNNIIRSEITKMVSSLALDSIVENKKMIRSAFDGQVEKQIVDESMSGLSRWVAERPQTAFKLMVQGNRKDKKKLKSKL